MITRSYFAAPLVLALAVGCGGAHPNVSGAVPNAIDSKIDWAPANVVDGKDSNGREVDEIAIRGGEIVRITLDNSGAGEPVVVGERVKSGTGFAESWRRVEPRDGALVVRGTLLGTAILVPKGIAVRAHIARAHDPGYAWFELEDHVLSWAKGPLPAPFPAVAPPERIDFNALAALDKALADAVSKARDKDAARDAATAVRRVAGLRALRSIRIPPGFPYFYDNILTPDGDSAHKMRVISGNKAWLVTTVDPMMVTVEGPRLLQIWSHGVRRDEDETVKLRVVEGDRERAVSHASLPHGRSARGDQLEVPVESAEVVPLRRATVHVPPGKHTYKIEAHGGNTFVAATASLPVVHIGDAASGVKDEDRQLKKALDARDASPEIYALALALAGRDMGPDWTALVEKLSPEARASAGMLASGGPRDPSIALEMAAASGDEKALAALGNAATKLVDDGLRAAWLRGTTRGTRWVVAEDKRLSEKRWLSLLVDTTEKKGCASAADDPWTEVGADDMSYSTTEWRGAPTVELMAAVTCSTKGPVKLEVDGTILTPNPSSSLSRWHVLVKGATARVRRTDGGEGKVYAIKPDAAQCGAHWGYIGAPRVASTSPELVFDKAVTAPGVELWIRDGKPASKVDVVSTVDPAVRATLVVTPRNGFVAVDNDGRRWVRVARVGLPTWASAGSKVVGGDDIAVRAIVRAPKGTEDTAGQAYASANESEAPKEAEPLDEAKLIALTRQLLTAEADGSLKGKKYFERAMMLAVSGEARAAIEDARAAKVLGAKGPKGEDPVQLVKTSIRPKPRKPLELPEGVKAYGVEPDFDPGAPRCAPSNGPRGQLASIVDDLRTAKAAATKVWDPSLAIRAFEAVNHNAMDPRAPTIVSWALAGSQWQVPKTLNDFPKVQRHHSSGMPGMSGKEGAIDPDGDLRARIGTGQPFDRASYATVTETRPARAGLTGTGSARARVEFACVARSPADAIGKDAQCPIKITVGTAVLKPKSGPDGRGSIDLPALPPKGQNTQVIISMDPAPGRWAAIARVVFDQEVPGSTKVGEGYVLMPPGLQWRFLVKTDQEISKTLEGPGLVRVDALAEPDEKPRVVVIVDGPTGPKETPVTIGGEPVVVPVPKGGTVKVKSVGGTSTIGFAERVPKAVTETSFEEAESEPVNAEARDDAEPTAVTTTALLDAGNPNALWRDAVSKSDKPLSPLEDALGTLSVSGRARTGTLRDGDPAKERDTFFEQSVGYRRRIESIGVWTGIGGLLREHEIQGKSFGASAFAWTHINPIRLRLAAFGEVYGQEIDGFAARTFRPHAYAEFSARLAPNVFLLPRIGYDGFYTNIEQGPKTLTGVDDDVYNNFRFRRPSVLYQQLTLWWVPYFNEILFLRARVNEDARRGLSHAGVRPGAIFAFGNLELGTYADATWFRATDGLRETSKTDVTGVGYALYNIWASPGSLDIQPGIGGRMRAGDGGWEVYALVNVFGSFRRGVRDFSSPELSFPEQFGGNVPWRGPAVGGTR